MKKQTDTANFPYIEQRESNDCGIAALCMLTRLPYSKVRRAVLAVRDKPFDGTTGDAAVAAGKLLGVSIQVLPNECTSKKSPCILIVPAADYATSKDLHAVFWTGSTLYDPSPYLQVQSHEVSKHGVTAKALGPSALLCPRKALYAF